MSLLPRRRPRRRLLVTAGAALALAAAGLTTTASPATTATPAAPRKPAQLSLASTQPELTGTVSGDKAPTSGLARTSPGLRGLDSARRVPVMIKYDYDAVASYTGGVRGLRATSPSVTGRSLTRPSLSVRAYQRHVADRERAISADVVAAAPGTRITRGFRIVYGGVAALVPGNRIDRVLDVPGVVAVQRDTLNQPLMDASPAFINATAAYNQLRTTRNAGQGILLGNLDSGVWPEHPLFADQGNLPAYAGPALPCDFGDNPLTPAVDPFACNDKLVGGASFTATYEALQGPFMYEGTARDAEGHGSHTASTSAGNVVTDVHTMGPVLPRINGVAPGAQIMEYRVCGPGGCFGSDTTAAVGQAILDGVDVINYSISGGTNPLTDPTELAFLDAYNAGIFVAASAGNSGPTAGTANHLSPWVTTVAASTQSREFASHLTLTSGTDTYEVDGASITAGAGPAPVVLASDPPYSNPQCNGPVPNDFTGKIVVCVRGGNGRVAKGYNVSQAGAAGMILVNPSLADVETDNHWLPAVHVADGQALLAFMAGHTDVTGTFTAGASRTGQGDVMAAFSSRGPAGQFVKPDITAPGVQILAAMTPTPEDPSGGPPGQYYQAIAGTSMSSPHIAGSAILVKAVHPSWSPGQIKSAIMTQARTTVVKQDLTTPADPFDMGAGRVDVGRALAAPLTISASGADFAALTGTPDAIDLNLPSINAPLLPGSITTTRTVKNVTGGSLKVQPQASMPANSKVTFNPATATLAAGQSATFQITISSTQPPGQQQFGSIRFVTKKGNPRIPVAFVTGQGNVKLSQACDAASVVQGASTTCHVTAENKGFGDAVVDLATSVNDRLQITGASGATVADGRATLSTTLAGAALGVPSVDAGSLAGYISLTVFGTVPIALGDEDLVNFNVPPFRYNGVTYTRIGVDSNGYLVVGGGVGADNNCCALPAGASPDRPNNVLAPFWTDLDGSGAPGLYASVLTDGVDEWLVVEWQVNVYGTSSRRVFQTWIGLNGTQDITFAYDPGDLPAAPGGGQPYLVGAENAAGEGDVSSFLPTSDLRVSSTDPTAGASLSYDVTVKGVKGGSGNVRTSLDTPVVRGTTVVNTPLQVVTP